MNRKTFAYIIALLIDLSNASIYLGLAFHLKEKLNASDFEIGLIGSLCPCSYAISCIFLDHFFSKRNHIISMRLGLVILLICIPPLFFLNTIWWAIPICFFYHFANALFYPSLQIWMTEGFGRKALQKVMGTYGVAWTTGFIVGPLLGGLAGQYWVINHWGPKYEGAYYVSLIVAVIVFIAIWFPFKHFIPDENNIKSDIDFTNTKPEDFKNYMMLGWMTNTLGNFCTGVIRFLIPVLMISDSGGALVLIGMDKSSYLLPFLSFSLLVTVIVMRYSNIWVLNFKSIIIIQLAVLPACLIFLFSHNYLLYFIPVIIFGMVNAFGFYTGAVYSLQLGEKGLKYITINEFLVGLGGFLGSLVGGVIANFYDSKWAFASPMLMMILMIILQISLKKKIDRASK